MKAKTRVFSKINMHGGDKEVCWEWTDSFNGKGLPLFRLGDKKVYPYRLVYELVHGPIPQGLVVRHKCDNGAEPVGCCNPHHLELGTPQDNVDDRTKRERQGLTHSMVKAIRRMEGTGRSVSEIKEFTGLPEGTIRDILARRTYKNVE